MNGHSLGLICGVVVGLIMTVILVKITSKDKKVKREYDERQILAQGKGFKIGFFVLIIYNTIYGTYSIIDSVPKINVLPAMVLGICISVACYATYCIWHDAYFSLNEVPVRLILVFIFFMIMNFVIGILNLFANNHTVYPLSINFIAGFMIVFILIVIVIKRIKNAREAED